MQTPVNEVEQNPGSLSKQDLSEQALGVTLFHYEKKMPKEMVLDCIQWTKDVVQSPDKTLKKSQHISIVRKQLEEKYGTTWQALTVTFSSGSLFNFINYNIISMHNDQIHMHFQYNGSFYVYFQTQSERQGKLYDFNKGIIQTKNSEFETKNIKNINRDALIDDEMLKIAIQAVEKSGESCKGDLITPEAITEIQNELNQKLNKEWQVCVFKNNAGWAYSVISEEQDQMSIRLDFKSLWHFLLFKTPQERDD